MAGAVVARGGRVVAEGYHPALGKPHAEVFALQRAGAGARGATLYVSLEPCCHHGRTPPCTDAIIRSGVARVVAAAIDPDPRVSGKGIAALRRARIEVEVGVLEAEARRLNEAYWKHVTTGLPFVTLKMAASLDGKIATRAGDSRWITGDSARAAAHRLRAEHDAVMVGIGTVIADDPELTARRGERVVKRPLRVIVDSRGRVPLKAKVLDDAADHPTIVAVTGRAPATKLDALRRRGAEPLVFEGQDGRVDIAALIAHLGRRGDLRSVLIEGGGSLAASALRAGLVDKVIWFIAAVMVGGRRAPTGVEGDGVARMADALPLEDVKVRRFGRDIMIEGYLRGRCLPAS